MNNQLATFDKSLDSFVIQNKLQPADAVLVKKQPLKLLNHYLLYLGIYRSRHIFMANTLSGIRVFRYDELMFELNTFQPEKIEKFIGSEYERRQAVERALMRKDENSYNLILNNCEHFKNWVQKGIHESNQAKTAGKIAVGAGATVALTSKSDTGKLIGLGIMLLGGLAWAFSDDEDNMPKPTHYPNNQLK